MTDTINNPIETLQIAVLSCKLKLSWHIARFIFKLFITLQSQLLIHYLP